MRDAAEVYLSILNMPPITRGTSMPVMKIVNGARLSNVRLILPGSNGGVMNVVHEMPPEWRTATRRDHEARYIIDGTANHHIYDM